MFSPKRNTPLCLIVIAIILSIVCGGCGSSSSSNNMSPTQAEAVTAQVMMAALQALQSTPFPDATIPAVTGKNGHPDFATVLKNIHPDATTGCTPTPNGGETCNWPVSYDGGCPGGGTISVDGDVDGTLDNTFTGSLDGTLTIIPSSCAVPNTGLVINGDPSVGLTGQLDLSDGSPTSVEFTQTGGISYGPNPSGSCQFNMTLSATLSGQAVTSCKISGTACGQSLSVTCQ